MEESKAVVTVGLTAYRELLGGLPEVQRQYISLIVRGMCPSIAEVLIRRTHNTLSHHWFLDPEFQKVKEYALSHQEFYQEEAKTVFLEALSMKAQELLDMLVEKGLREWDKLGKDDKKAVIQAVSLVRRDIHAKEGSSANYDELILRRHFNA